jgi:signal transduction histidine kinase
VDPIAAVRDIGSARTTVQVADALARHAASLVDADGALVYLRQGMTADLAIRGRFGSQDRAAPERIAGARAPSRPLRPQADSAASTALVTTDATDGPGEVETVEIPFGRGPSVAGILRLHWATATGVPHLRAGSRATLVAADPWIELLGLVAADAVERTELQAARRSADGQAAASAGTVTTLARLAAELVGATTVDQVARTLVDLAVDDLAAGFAVVHVSEPGSRRFELVRARGYPAGLLASERRIERDAQGPVTRAARERALVDVAGEDGWRAAFPRASNVPSITGVRAITALPMLVAGVVHGVLTVGWRTVADREAADDDLLAAAADQGAQALERAILHAQDEDARRLQEAFIAVVSHELRTPITTILAGSRLLRRGLEAGSQAAELGDDIEAEADRLARIVDDLLVLSRLERRHLTLGDEPVHLDHLLRRVVRSEAARWPGHEMLLPSPGSHVVRGDETYIEQVLRNLVSNAAKYSPEGSHVEVLVDDAADGEIRVRVLDRGAGVAPAEVDDLFSLFYRSPATAASAAGAGIGLFVSRRLVAEMGGRMWAQPRPDGGSEFGFSLVPYPVDEADLEGAGPDRTARASRRATAAPGARDSRPARPTDPGDNAGQRTRSST